MGLSCQSERDLPMIIPAEAKARQTMTNQTHLSTFVWRTDGRLAFKTLHYKTQVSFDNEKKSSEEPRVLPCQQICERGHGLWRTPGTPSPGPSSSGFHSEFWSFHSWVKFGSCFWKWVCCLIQGQWIKFLSATFYRTHIELSRFNNNDLSLKFIDNSQECKTGLASQFPTFYLVMIMVMAMVKMCQKSATVFIFNSIQQ